MNELGTEIADRQRQRDTIAALFRSHALREIESADLKQITPHYQQRISECRRVLKMRIVNVPRSVIRADGSRKKLDGAYKFLPYEPLERDSTMPTVQRDLTF